MNHTITFLRISGTDSAIMTNNNPLKFFILTGEPGVGKTTMTKNIISSLVSADGVKTSGFYTEEVRRNRTREGFDVVTLDGQRGRLARDLSLSAPVKHKVGKYGVLVQEFENIALPCLEKHKENNQQLLVIDEVGKMELFSDPFRARIREIFSPAAEQVVLATIPARRGEPLVEAIRTHARARVWVVTKENRNTIHEVILQEIKRALQTT